MFASLKEKAYLVWWRVHQSVRWATALCRFSGKGSMAIGSAEAESSLGIVARMPQSTEAVQVGRSHVGTQRSTQSESVQG